MKTRSSARSTSASVAENSADNDHSNSRIVWLTLPSDALSLVLGFLPNLSHFFKAMMQYAPSSFISSEDPVITKTFALYLAMQYLPLRDISAMSLVGKFARSSISTEMVVRAAYMRTGDRNNTRKSVDELYKLMSANAIHPPSPLRLLRIALGNKCEFCSCVHKTLAEWSYGVFACWSCVSEKRESLTKAWNTTWVRYKRNKDKFDAVISHPRNAISKLYGKKYYVWEEHRTTASGEKIGPIMAWEDIDGAVDYMEGEESDEYIQKVDEYIDDKLGASPSIEYIEFNRTYLAAKADLEEWAERAEREKAERRRVREERKRKRESEQQAKDERKRKREAAKQAKEAKKQADASADSNDAVADDQQMSNQNAEGSNNEPAPAANIQELLVPSDVVAVADDQSGPSENAAARSAYVQGGQRVCAACNQSKGEEHFSKTQRQNRGRFARCKSCIQGNREAKLICTGCTRSGMGCFSKAMQTSCQPLRCKDCVKDSFILSLARIKEEVRRSNLVAEESREAKLKKLNSHLAQAEKLKKDIQSKCGGY